MRKTNNSNHRAAAIAQSLEHSNYRRSSHRRDFAFGSNDTRQNGTQNNNNKHNDNQHNTMKNATHSITTLAALR